MIKEKIIVFADAHANKNAVEYLYSYAEKEKINKILNLGDMVQIGPLPKETIDIIRADNRTISIIGNNETILFEILNEDSISKEQAHQMWTIEELGKERIQYLRSLPEERYLQIADKKAIMIHSRKCDNKEMPLIYSKSIEEFVKDYEFSGADIILFGHSHEQLYIEHDSKIYLNPGSLGCSKTSSIKFAIIVINENNNIQIEFKNEKYDNTRTIEEYKNKNVPDKEFLKKVFHRKIILIVRTKNISK